MARRDNDFYPTPLSTVYSLLDNYYIEPNSKILEPCAGNGRIIQALQEYGFTDISAIELRQEEEEHLRKLLENITITDFLTADIVKCDVIITNPPFSLALEFLNKSLTVASDKVIMLLRVGFLASKRRFDFMKNNPPTDLLVLHKRPSFLENGVTDSQEYAWFVWDKKKTSQTIKVI